MKWLPPTLAALVSGCSALQAIEPNSLAPEFEHVSHLTQHQPFTDHPTNYGTNILGLTAEWNVGKHIYATLSEGVSLTRQNQWGYCGEMYGPREEFTGRIGYKFILKETGK